MNLRGWSYWMLPSRPGPRLPSLPFGQGALTASRPRRCLHATRVPNTHTHTHGASPLPATRAATICSCLVRAPSPSASRLSDPSDPICAVRSVVRSSRRRMQGGCCRRRITNVPANRGEAWKREAISWKHSAAERIYSTGVDSCRKAAMDSMCHFEDRNKHTTLQWRRAFLKWKFVRHKCQIEKRKVHEKNKH